MNVGFVGLGKLGYPVATTIALKGHEVVGYDINSSLMRHGPRGYREAGPDGTGDLWKYLDEHKEQLCSHFRFDDLVGVAAHAELIFIAVQTPHEPAYEGITPLPHTRADFDYSYLREAVSALASVITRPTVVAVISTVLPGTMRREIEPLLNDHMSLVYTPQFIAMGTVMRDYLNPEFVLFGVRKIGASLRKITDFYYSVVRAPLIPMSIESAELTKVAYNIVISSKIGIANALMEICDKVRGADIDEVTGALAAADRRLLSPMYLRGGMGDGGGCHPRDNIAMSWLARKLELKHDIFESVMMAREGQAVWLADMLIDISEQRGLPIGILGTAFKRDVAIDTGSHARLVIDILRGAGHPPALVHDPYVGGDPAPSEPMVLLVGCNHTIFQDYHFHAGTVIIDPWRYLGTSLGAYVIPVGAGWRLGAALAEERENEILPEPKNDVIYATPIREKRRFGPTRVSSCA